MKSLVFALSLSFVCLSLRAELPIIKVGSKIFTESYILAEIISQIVEDTGEARVERKFGLGGSGISFKALKEKEVDLYSEYTGTIKEAILKNPLLGDADSVKAALLKKHNLTISPSLGFNNTYALAMRTVEGMESDIKKISDLEFHQDLKVVFTHEFMKRADGLRALERHYGFQFRNPVAMVHALGYEALKNEKVDLMEVYTTDAKINRYKLQLIEDDKNFFPQYLAVLLHGKDFQQRFPKTYQSFEERLFGKINENVMTELNSLVELQGYSFAQAAGVFLGKEKIHAEVVPLKKIMKLALQHLKLVFVSLFFSILFGVPLGILATKNKLLAQITLIGSGLLQTIPSLALLCFFIPLFGIGNKPAYVALFLYGLLPIVRNTFTGITQIKKNLDESADLIGLTPWEKLKLIQLPLASINILAGIKTSAIINVGTATLAAFIGAGGLGSLIVTGLSLNNNKIILAGAIPAALLATVLHLIFELVDRILIPRGMRR